MNKYIDLHTHSVYSEGALTVGQLIGEAKKNNIAVLSLTDHNTVAGVAEAVKIGRQEKITVIPGVEIYTHFHKYRLHLLGYNLDIHNPELQKALDQLARQRITKIKKSLAVLKKQTGFTINEARLFNTPSRYPGFAHIIGELKKSSKNLAKIKQDLKTDQPNFFDIINKYFGPATKACLPETGLPIAKALELIHRAGGLAVLAHPAQQLSWKTQVVSRLKSIGLDGLEILSPYHRWHDIEHWQNTAAKLKLVVTGGSDFHARLSGRRPVLINEQWQYFKVPYAVYRQLKPRLTKYQ